MAVNPMKKSSLANHERHLKWEKVKIDRQVNQLILAQAATITETLLDIGINERNPNVLNSLLDRAFGKARQNIGLDGGAEDKPIVFMPAVLLQKYGIQAGTYREVNEPGADVDAEPVGMLREPIESGNVQ